MPTNINDVAEKAADAIGRYGDRLEKLERDVSEYRALAIDGTKAAAAARLGKSGAEDFFSGLADIARAAVTRAGGPSYAKAADLLSISTDARGGYIVPDDYATQLDDMLTAYGDLLGMVRFVQGEPGRPLHVPYWSTAPEASWQTTEGGEMTEADAQVARATLTPRVLGAYSTFSNELLAVQKSVDLGAVIANQLVTSIGEKLEYALLLGDDSAGAYPHDGLLVASGVNSQTALATPTAANLWTFIRESLEDVPGLIDGESVLVTTPAVWAALLSSSAVNEYTSSADGAGRRFAGWRVAVSPAAISTTNRVLMLNPKSVWVARSQYLLDVDPFGLFTSNRSRMRVVAHVDYAVPQPANVSKAVITAMS